MTESTKSQETEKTKKVPDEPRQPGNSKSELTFNYFDANGQLLYQVVRLPEKEFRYRRPSSSRGWIWNLQDIQRVLYRLPELVTDVDQQVFIVEGEKDSDRLASEGFVATTNPGGPGQWRKEYSEYFQDRDVIILPDNDLEGKDHANQIAKSLHGKTKSIKVIELPNLPENGDVSDWLDAGNTVEDLGDLITNAGEWENKDLPTRADDEEKSKLTHLVKIIESTGIEAIKDLRGMGYVVLPKSDGSKIIPAMSKSFEGWIQRIAWKQMGWAMSKPSLSTVAKIMECKGIYDGEEHDLRVRVAKHGSENWVNIDGCKGVRITPGKWDITEQPRIFKSLLHQRDLPIPDRNGNYSLIKKYISRVKDEDDRILLHCWLHTCFIADIEIPMLSFWGYSKAGKSTLQRLIRRLTDPCYPEYQDKNIAVQDIPIIASQHRLMCFDNPRSLNPNQSDFLCGSVTGDGSEKRQHYEDESLLGREYQNVITISSVPCIVTEPDLANRSIIMEFDQPDPADKRKKTEIWEDLKSDAPYILGGIFDNLAKALQVVDGLKLKWSSRFDEFTEIAAAVAEVLGYGADKFVECYRRKMEGQSLDIAESEPVAIALRSYYRRMHDFEQSPTHLHENLTLEAGMLGLDTRGHGWPKQPNQLTHRLKYLKDSLMTKVAVC